MTDAIVTDQTAALVDLHSACISQRAVPAAAPPFDTAPAGAREGRQGADRDAALHFTCISWAALPQRAA